MSEAQSDGNGSALLLRRAWFCGVRQGEIKSLRGYTKSRSLPETATPQADAWLRTMAEEDLQQWGEELFRELRVKFGLHRSELRLEPGPEGVVVQVPGFRVDLELRVNPDCSRQYLLSTEVSHITDPALLEGEAFARVFGKAFDRMIVQCSQAINIEEIIDRIEALDDPEQVMVDYPSDASSCVVMFGNAHSKLHFKASRLTLMAEKKLPMRELLGTTRQVELLFESRQLQQMLFGSQ